MEKLSIEHILAKIEREEIFEAVAEDYSFTLKIEAYVHYVCGAVHDGHQFRRELWDNCLHSEYERWFEEDPCTKEFVKTHRILIAGRDSRFEYDLNREPEGAIYESAWGKKLWKEALTREEQDESLQKHTNFYRVVEALIKKLEAKFGVVVVYDIHSYNWRRWEREVPVVNLGTSNIDNQRFGGSAEAWCQSLSEMILPNGMKSTSEINNTFFGNGYFLKFITRNFKNTLVLATEFKKIYCDEQTEVIFPEVVAAIEKELRDRLPAHAAAFYREHGKL